MGCCMTATPPPTVAEINEMHKVGSYTETTKDSKIRQFAHKPEPQISHDSFQVEPAKKNSLDKSDSKPIESEMDLDKDTEDSYSPDSPNHPPMTRLESQKSDFQLKVEQRKSELLREREKLAQLQKEAFDQQVAAQQCGNFKRLYDVWEEYATSEDGTTMDIHGLTKAVAVFGMIIDTDRDFQRHIFKKFDLDGLREITYNDFSATIASFVGSNTDDDSLQTLFEIFDIDQDGYLEVEDMARIFLAQNQMAVVVTGQTSENKTKALTKKQCLKQARRMIAEYDSEEFNDNKISFNEFKSMMHQRTENDMLIDHMQAPSMSLKNTSGEHELPMFIEELSN